MITVNMYGGAQNWWAEQQKKKESYKAPDKCTFCNRKIEDGDFFYVGRDKNKIFAETCDNLKCHTWLKYKLRLKKMAGKDYLKEAEERVKEQK